MHKRLRMLAVVAWLLAAWPLAGAFGQDAAAPTLEKYGWWNANQTLPEDPTGGLLPPVAVPAPPGAPEDGLYVEATVDGTPRAIAAVTYFTGGGVDSSLTLSLSDGASADGVTVAACPAGGGWDAVQNGRWDRQPTYDPAACTFLGTRDKATITFRIPAAAHEPASNYLSVAIVPAEGSGAFTASFKAPTSESLVTRAPSAAAPSSSPSPAATPVFEPGPVTFGGPAFEAPLDPVIAAPTTPTTPTKGKAVASPAKPTAIATRAQGSDRVVAGALIALVGAAMWAVTMRAPAREPRLLGTVGSESRARS